MGRSWVAGISDSAHGGFTKYRTRDKEQETRGMCSQQIQDRGSREIRETGGETRNSEEGRKGRGGGDGGGFCLRAKRVEASLSRGAPEQGSSNYGSQRPGQS